MGDLRLPSFPALSLVVLLSAFPSVYSQRASAGTDPAISQIMFSHNVQSGSSSMHWNNCYGTATSMASKCPRSTLADNKEKFVTDIYYVGGHGETRPLQGSLSRIQTVLVDGDGTELTTSVETYDDVFDDCTCKGGNNEDLCGVYNGFWYENPAIDLATEITEGLERQAEVRFYYFVYGRHAGLEHFFDPAYDVCAPITGCPLVTYSYEPPHCNNKVQDEGEEGV